MTAPLTIRKGAGCETSRLQLPVSGLLMVCAWCKKVRDGAGAWQRIEERHVREKPGGVTSHGLCPDCANAITREWEPAGLRAA